MEDRYCDDCGCKMESTEIPPEYCPLYTFRIPLTNITVSFSKYGQYEYYCLGCYVDSENDSERKAYEAGCQDTYDKLNKEGYFDEHR